MLKTRDLRISIKVNRKSFPCVTISGKTQATFLKTSTDLQETMLLACSVVHAAF